MRKTLACIIIFVVLGSILCNISYATEETSITLGWTSAISEDGKKVTVTLSIDSLTGLPESVTAIGYEANLKYKKELFSSVEVKNIDGWQNSYVDTTGNIVGECTNKANFKSNQDIAVFTFTLAEGVETIDTKIELTSIGVSFDGEPPITLGELSADAKIIESVEDNNSKTDEETQNSQEGKDETQDDKITQTPTDNKSKAEEITKKAEETQKKKETTVKANGDQTTTSTILPKTGLTKIMVIITFVTVFGLICGIRYKSIKLK